MRINLPLTVAALILVCGLPSAMAQTTSPAYRYSGPHAGGPADDLNRGGAVQPVVRPVKPPAYGYSGSHAGGPANDLNRGGAVQPVVRPLKPPAYGYSGSHAGGPANGQPRN